MVLFLNFSKIMIFQLMAFVCMLITIFWNDVEMKKEKKIVVKWASISQQKHSKSWAHLWAEVIGGLAAILQGPFISS